MPALGGTSLAEVATQRNVVGTVARSLTLNWTGSDPYDIFAVLVMNWGSLTPPPVPSGYSAVGTGWAETHTSFDWAATVMYKSGRDGAHGGSGAFSDAFSIDPASANAFAIGVRYTPDSGLMLASMVPAEVFAGPVHSDEDYGTKAGSGALNLTALDVSQASVSSELLMLGCVMCRNVSAFSFGQTNTVYANTAESQLQFGGSGITGSYACGLRARHNADSGTTETGRQFNITGTQSTNPMRIGVGETAQLMTLQEIPVEIDESSPRTIELRLKKVREGVPPYTIPTRIPDARRR